MEYEVKTADDAKRVITQMQGLIEAFGFATHGDLKDALGLQANHHNRSIGWHDMGGFKVVYNVEKDSYTIVLPDAEHMEERATHAALYLKEGGTAEVNNLEYVVAKINTNTQMTVVRLERKFEPGITIRIRKAQ